MKIVIASSNKGKIKEFEKLLNQSKIYTAQELLGDIDIVEDGSSFKQNAIIKAKVIYKKLTIKYKNDTFLVISDDSGISVPILNNEPNIYSARYAKIGATSKENNEKLIGKLKAKDITSTSAFYTACICMIYDDNIYTTHGWMYGDVIDKQIGENGFGYDPLFIPKGYDKTLGQLDYKQKETLSHRTKALNLAKIIMRSIL